MILRDRTPLDDLTVCITNFKRPEFLDRAIQSCRSAGIRRLTIAAVCPTPEVMQVILKHKGAFGHYDVTGVEKDIGCNDTWTLAARMSKTKRIIVLHDDDLLRPGFGNTYNNVISPALDRGDTFASWRASLLFMDGSTEAAEYYHGPAGLQSSDNIRKVVADRARFSLSPIISVLDRDTVIAATEESAEVLTKIPDCIYRPGMLLGTEIVVYLRHVEKFPNWLYVDHVLAHYGSHDGSGTIDAQRDQQKIDRLYRGYNAAREHCERNPK